MKQRIPVWRKDQKLMSLRGAPPKKRRGKPRRGTLRDGRYRVWIACHLCYVCYPKQRIGGTMSHAVSQASHTVNNGQSSKGPDSGCWPLCWDIHHPEFDKGKKVFETKYNVDATAIAKQYWDYYCEHVRKD